MRLLRRMKAEGALLIALADIGGVWPVMRVTAALTALADAAVAARRAYLLSRRRAPRPLSARRSGAARAGQRLHRARHGQDGRGRAQLFERHRPDRASSTPTRHALAADVEPSPFFVRLTQRLVKLLQERTADGYVFRTDLRLRPDPASTQIAISTAAGARLLRERRAELGARRHDQGAALRRRHRGRRGVPQASCRPSSGASISTSPRSPTSTR